MTAYITKTFWCKRAIVTRSSMCISFITFDQLLNFTQRNSASFANKILFFASRAENIKFPRSDYRPIVPSRTLYCLSCVEEMGRNNTRNTCD